jgi:hypothetical protein
MFARVVFPSEKTTDPVGAPFAGSVATVAVKVTELVRVDGFDEEEMLMAAVRDGVSNQQNSLTDVAGGNELCPA